MQLSKNKTTLFNIASTIVLQGLTFISGPIFSGVLGTENYGIATVYLTWVTLASTVFSLQAASSIANARIQFPMEEQPKYQSSVFTLSTFSYIFFSFVTLIGVYIFSRWFSINITMVAFGLVQGWGMYCVSAMNLKLTYEFRADKNFILSVVTSALTISLSIAFIHLFPVDHNYWGRIIGQAVVYAIIGIVIFVVILQSGKTYYNKHYWLFTLPITVPTIFHSLANIVLNQSDKIMLQNMVSNSAVGIYALACTFGTVLHSIWNAFNNSWVPFYYEYTKQHEIEKMKQHARNYVELFTIISCGFILLAKEVFHVYAHSDFWSGTDMIPLFAIGHYFIFLYSFPVNYEFYNKKTKTIAVGTSLAAVSNIFLNYLMIRLFGIIGAVLATMISHGLQFVFHFICANRVNPGEFPFRFSDFIPGFLVVCATCVFYWFTKELWIIRWVFGVILGIYILTKIIRRKEIF